MGGELILSEQRGKLSQFCSEAGGISLQNRVLEQSASVPDIVRRKKHYYIIIIFSGGGGGGDGGGGGGGVAVVVMKRICRAPLTFEGVGVVGIGGSNFTTTMTMNTTTKAR